MLTGIVILPTASLSQTDLKFGRFVDRDMFMRYMGGGVGHFNTTSTGTDTYILGGEVYETEEDVQFQPLVGAESDSEGEVSDYDEAVEENYDV